jgi:hypothetical protein
MRQSPARKNSGRMANAEPTSPSDQTPDQIFGANTALSGTGLPGSSGAHAAPGSDMTEVNDETYEGISGHHETHDLTSLAGTPGASSRGGGETITYTDPFAHIGGVVRDVTAHGAVSGNDDWTQGAGKYATGPALPGIEGNRPTDTGLGRGHLRGAGKGL